MATRTSDDMLAEIRRQIDELEARANSGAAETRARLQDGLDRLREQEASAWEAVRKKAEAVDERFRQLEIDIAIAEDRLASELADDATSFEEAVEADSATGMPRSSGSRRAQRRRRRRFASRPRPRSPRSSRRGTRQPSV